MASCCAALGRTRSGADAFRFARIYREDDALMCDWFADRVISLDAAGKPFLAGLLTLSSHKPFDVPYSKFEDPVLNAMAFSDDCEALMTPDSE